MSKVNTVHEAREMRGEKSEAVGASITGASISQILPVAEVCTVLTSVGLL